MKQTIRVLVLILSIHQCFGQNGFPKQFEASLNISGFATIPFYSGVQQLLFDYNNLRVRFDVQGWRANQSEAYMLKYKPEDAEPDSVCQTKEKKTFLFFVMSFCIACFRGLYDV